MNIFAVEYGCLARVAARFVATVVLSMVLAATVIGCGGSGGEKKSGEFRMNNIKLASPRHSSCNYRRVQQVVISVNVVLRQDFGDCLLSHERRD